MTGEPMKRRPGEFELGNDQLIGDAAAARAYREILVELQTSLGRGLSQDLARRTSRTLDLVSTALRAQEDRIHRGEEPASVPSDVAAELFDGDAFADRLLSIDTPATISGRARRGLLDLLGWWQRGRKARP